MYGTKPRFHEILFINEHNPQLQTSNVPREKFYNKCPENSRSQIVFRADIFRKLTLGAPAMTNKPWLKMNAKQTNKDKINVSSCVLISFVCLFLSF